MVDWTDEEEEALDEVIAQRKGIVPRKGDTKAWKAIHIAAGLTVRKWQTERTHYIRLVWLRAIGVTHAGIRSPQISFEEVLIQERDGELGPTETWPKGAMPSMENEAKLRATFEAYGTTLGVKLIELSPSNTKRKRSAAPEIEPQRDVKPKIDALHASTASTESRRRARVSSMPAEEPRVNAKATRQSSARRPARVLKENQLRSVKSEA